MERLRNVAKRELPSGLQWLLLGLAALFGTPLLLMVAYNLAAPLFHAPSMTYSEALGLTILAGMLVGVVAILKE